MMRKMLLTLALAGVLVGCGGDDDDSTEEAADCEVVDGTEAEPTSTIDVTLDEFSIDAPATAEAGVVEIEAMNDGEEHHEIVVLEAPIGSIETDEDGAPIEVGLVGEIEGFPGGDTCTGAFELTAGEYTLLCAIVEEEENGELESHFLEGMATSLTVS